MFYKGERRFRLRVVKVALDGDKFRPLFFTTRAFVDFVFFFFFTPQKGGIVPKTDIKPEPVYGFTTSNTPFLHTLAHPSNI